MTTKPDAAALISVDWGTTSLRLYLLGGDGGILDKRETAQGITSVAKDEFPKVLRAGCGEWITRHGALPAVLSGMVGSRQGWVEARYVTCPAGLAELATSSVLLEVDGFAGARIIAGVDTRDALGIPDVMRGEECQIMGALAAMDCDGGTFVLPGTHSKWVEVRDGRIVSFRTCMTGEVFAALKGHTILGRMMVDGGSAPSDVAFLRGVEIARRSGAAGEWLHRLFSVRTLGLMGELADEQSADYLSGLMIGWEMASLAQACPSPLILVGSPDLSRRYAEAARCLGLGVVAAPADCVCAGHMRIARAAGWVMAPASDGSGS